MCGIAGFWDGRADQSAEKMESLLRRMGDQLIHRGPDDGGVFASAPDGLGFAHRRLAIVDLTREGHQPMFSHGGRYLLVFNGEIYNHRRLRADLESAGPVAWRGRSDTETLLACIERHGLERALASAEGMFALALWDREAKRLRLAVDRLGEKPLYYGIRGGRFLFGSELKALLPAASGWEIDPSALPHYLRFGYVPAPLSIYRGILKLTPGHIATLDRRNLSAQALPETEPYWTLEEAWAGARSAPFPGDEPEALDRLDGLLREVIADQLEADVPVGVFLSGGIDSSAVAAIAQSVSPKPVNTFTIGFSDKDYDEAAHARKVAAHLGTSHVELYLTPEAGLDVISSLPRMYDEPFADSSQIPTSLVCALGRKHAAVSLSGDGGDEVFGGYNRYTWGASLARRMERIPLGLRKVAAKGIGMLPPKAWDRLWGQCQEMLPRRLQVSNPGVKLHKIADNLSAVDGWTLYQGLVSQWRQPESLLRAAAASSPLRRISEEGFGSVSEWMMLQDMAQYLPGDILAKVDRASMFHSLETRAPFLNHRVVEWAMSLPLELKIRKGTGKHLLRTLLHRYIPREMVERPKMGFALPLNSWLRGPLRPWAEEMLSPERLEAAGLFNPDPIRRKWKEHLSGYRDWTPQLWAILMFEAWRRESPAR
jgi:asparagine synthase (glutamine-hydrolysing)